VSRVLVLFFKKERLSSSATWADFQKDSERFNRSPMLFQTYSGKWHPDGSQPQEFV
jgi:hypothetical protein